MEREMQMLRALASMPFVDALELAVILGEAYATMHRALTGLLADGTAGRINHGTVHLPTSGRWFLTAEGVGEASATLGFETPSEFVRAYPVSQQWLTLLLRRMDAVASVTADEFRRGAPGAGVLYCEPSTGRFAWSEPP